MGKNVSKRNFNLKDKKVFKDRLKKETDLLLKWCKTGKMRESITESGFELELCILDENLTPDINNLKFIESAHSTCLTSEAAKCCLEINLPYKTLEGDVLYEHQQALENLMKIYTNIANKNHQSLISVGTIPNARIDDYDISHLTEQNRYHALDSYLKKSQSKTQNKIIINGEDQLEMPANNFALVGAINSFQIHLGAGSSKAAKLYNVMSAISAPMVAMCSNSPFMFGKGLWHETRISFYEQVFPYNPQVDKLPRVFFGTHYVKESISELFVQNLNHYEPLLAQVMDEPAEVMSHLQLHNGNIYRWNRPVLDFDKNGRPHFRIEHRPLSAGTSIVDMLADAAFFFGLIKHLIAIETPIEDEISFDQASQNFYLAAQCGLHSEIKWTNGQAINCRELILSHLLPMAKKGLIALEINKEHIQRYLSIIEERVSKNISGSIWQKNHFSNHQDFKTLIESYLALQQSGKPVHEWPMN